MTESFGAMNRRRLARQLEVFGSNEVTYPYYKLTPYLSHCGIKSPEMFNIDKVTMENGIELSQQFVGYLEYADALKVLEILEENEELKRRSHDLHKM